jgi:hypothetical protein
MAQKQEWSQLKRKPALWFWLALFLFSSYMLYKQWKGGTPWPLGAFMPF